MKKKFKKRSLFSLYSLKTIFIKRDLVKGSALGLCCLMCFSALSLRAEQGASSLPEQKTTQEEATTYRTPTIEVIGGAQDSMKNIPGSGVVLDQDVLDLEQPISVQDALKGIPGVNLRSEDAVGLIPNIGIRGLNPDRSEKILFLEDGMFAGLAPYTENAAYYVPPIERMERLELLKGSGSILYGPQTVGGVINFITPDVPKNYRSNVRVDGGNEAYLMGIGRFGKTWGPVGLDISALHKQGDGFTRDESQFRLSNYTGKLKFALGEKTRIILKNNFQDQRSSQSYLGLTTDLFEGEPRFNPSPDDRLDLERYDLQFSLQHFFTDRIELITNIYYWHAQRNWNRQDFSRNIAFAPPPANTVDTYGDPTLEGGAIYMLSSFGARDRTFEAAGIEPRLLMDFDAFGHTHHLHAGARFHFEEMIDARDNTTTLGGVPRIFDRDVRQTYAFAFFFQTTLNITDRLSLIPGFRLEQYTQNRFITQLNYVPVNYQNSSVHWVPIPGFGITYEAAPNTTLFTGIHRGFSPPRTSQAISSTGQDLDLEPEFSWNYELGVRSNYVSWWSGETTFFFMDFSNQVVPANESGGASTSDTNAGQTRHLGVEFASALDMLGMAGLDSNHRFYLDTRYTFVDSKNTTPGGPFEGKDLPYAPRNSLMLGVRYSGQAGATRGLDLGLEGLFTSSQYADQANIETPSNSGLVGKIPAYWLMNIYGRYKVPKTRLEANLTVNNILNSTYIVSRAPQGIFPGSGIQVIGGLRYDFFGDK